MRYITPNSKHKTTNRVRQWMAGTLSSSVLYLTELDLVQGVPGFLPGSWLVVWRHTRRSLAHRETDTQSTDTISVNSSAWILLMFFAEPDKDCRLLGLFIVLMIRFRTWRSNLQGFIGLPIGTADFLVCPSSVWFVLQLDVHCESFFDGMRNLSRSWPSNSFTWLCSSHALSFILSLMVWEGGNFELILAQAKASAKMAWMHVSQYCICACVHVCICGM